MQNNSTVIQKDKTLSIESHHGFECWEFNDTDIIVSFPDKNLLIPTNKKTVLGAFLKELNDNLRYQNRIKQIANVQPIPYFISFTITTISAIIFFDYYLLCSFKEHDIVRSFHFLVWVFCFYRIGYYELRWDPKLEEGL